MKQPANGFTLLEVLVSISIFSVLGLGAYQMLDTVATSHERVRATADGYTRLNLVLSIMQRDFGQFVPRQVRDEYGEPLPPIMFEGEDYLIEFTRGGWSNPAGRQRSRLQRVAYSLDYDEETLTRYFWEVLDRAEDSEPRSEVLLTGITDFRVTGFSPEGSEGDDSSFDIDELGGMAPVAVEVALALEGTGEIQRLFPLADPYVAATRPGGQGDESPGDGDQENNPDGQPADAGEGGDGRESQSEDDNE